MLERKLPPPEEIISRVTFFTKHLASFVDKLTIYVESELDFNDKDNDEKIDLTSAKTSDNKIDPRLIRHDQLVLHLKTIHLAFENFLQKSLTPKDIEQLNHKDTINLLRFLNEIIEVDQELGVNTLEAEFSSWCMSDLIILASLPTTAEPTVLDTYKKQLAMQVEITQLIEDIINCKSHHMVYQTNLDKYNRLAHSQVKFFHEHLTGLLKFLKSDGILFSQITKISNTFENFLQQKTLTLDEIALLNQDSSVRTLVIIEKIILNDEDSVPEKWKKIADKFNDKVLANIILSESIPHLPKNTLALQMTHEIKNLIEFMSKKFSLFHRAIVSNVKAPTLPAYKESKPKETVSSHLTKHSIQFK